MKLVVFEDEDGRTVAINPSLVSRVMKNGGNSTKIMINLGSTTMTHYVNEPFETVVAKLNGDLK